MANLSLFIQNKYPIEETVAGFFGIEKNDLKRRTNAQTIVIPRQIIIWLQANINRDMYKSPKWKMIGDKFNMHYTSAIHSYKAVNDRMEVDRRYRNLIYDIQKNIFNSVKYEIKAANEKNIH